MTDCLAHLRNLLDEELKNLCGRLSPDRRFAVILALGILLAVVNFWVLFRAVYNIGREEVLQELLELQEMPELPELPELPKFPPLQIPNYIPQDTLHDAIRQQIPDISNDNQSSDRHDDE